MTTHRTQIYHKFEQSKTDLSVINDYQVVDSTQTKSDGEELQLSDQSHLPRIGFKHKNIGEIFTKQCDISLPEVNQAIILESHTVLARLSSAEVFLVQQTNEDSEINRISTSITSTPIRSRK